MGTTLVATMVQSDADGPPNKPVHPFFTRTPDSAQGSPSVAHLNEVSESENAEALEHEGRGGKKRSTNVDLSAENEWTPEPKKQKRKRKSGRSSLNDDITNHLTKPVDAGPPPPSEATVDHTPSSTKENEQRANETPSNPSATSTAAPRSSPQHKKVLKFNVKTGTLGSPPKPKKTSPPSKIVTINYGSDDAQRVAIGQKITAILETPPEPPATPPKRKRGRPKKPQAPIAATESPLDLGQLEPRKVEGSSTAKGTHPFFTGKGKPRPQESKPRAETPPKPSAKRHTISMATPVSPRKPWGPPPKAAHFGSLNNPGLLRIPGAKHPAWPAQGMSHVRGDLEPRGQTPNIDYDVLRVDEPALKRDHHMRFRKFKGQTVNVSQKESVVTHYIERLGLETLRTSNGSDDNGLLPLPRELRLPTRQFESGRKLQARIRRQLHTLRQHQAGEELENGFLSANQLSQTHPFVARLYESLETRLSAYDQSTCENSLWHAKYLPHAAAEVLQAGKEAMYLKDWLQALRVQSVDTGTVEACKDKGKVEKPKKRRKRLDDFVVDSDEGDDELDEVSGDERDWTPAGFGQRSKTILRPVRKENTRLNNVMVISGPHGSGKTAAVYAVAKEIGYEVFEINSSSRRSGKDLLDKIGDMTKNHLVQQHQAKGAVDSEESIDKTEEDIKSGKQGTMTSFFKAKVQPPAEPKKASSGQAFVPEAKTSQKSQRAQKQSLILLEEIDILYEEDKQFWPTLMTMIAQSRRPFIMTCNDESLVPLQTLPLHGILRFSPPPTELAVDVSLLIAANEGHALKREAVESLYVSRGYDLRATVAELNYWCQIGVGDRKNGFEWFYLRWPRSVDQDENGDTVRVISENTYLKGMGWLAHDQMARGYDWREVEEDAIHQSWDSWQVAMGDWEYHLDMRAYTKKMSQDSSRESKRAAVDVYQDFCETLSDGDVFSNSAYASAMREIVDPGVPDMPAKMREDFSLGRQLLDVEPVTAQASLERDITTTLSSTVRQCLMGYTNATGNHKAASLIGPVDEPKAISILESSFKKIESRLTRMDLAQAFDPIAVSESSPSTHLEPSVFDRTFNLINLDVAPWVRSIVTFDEQLAKERKKLSNLLSEGGDGGKRKRFRNTRAAYSALEGGERKSTRREKYFQGTINPQLVMRTGLQEWQDAAKEELEAAETDASTATSPDASKIPQADDWVITTPSTVGQEPDEMILGA